MMLLYCSVIACILLGILAVAAYASFIKFWPYNFSFTLGNYDFDLMDGGGWRAYRNSMWLGVLTACGWAC